MSATQIILLERVDNLGEMGEVVSVKPGYARNYLLPQKKALRASKENIAYFEAQKKQLEAENEKRKAEAQKVAQKISDLKVPLIRQASEAGQLYGSVAGRDIAEALTELSGEKIARGMVIVNQNFKSLGLFPVEVAVHPEVKVVITINIARSEEEAKVQEKTGKALVDGANDDIEEKSAPEDASGEDALKDVLDEEGLAAQKEKQAAEEAKAAEEAQAAEKAKAKAEAKKAKAEAEAEAASEEASDEQAEEAEAENSEEE